MDSGDLELPSKDETFVYQGLEVQHLPLKLNPLAGKVRSFYLLSSSLEFIKSHLDYA